MSGQLSVLIWAAPRLAGLMDGSEGDGQGLGRPVLKGRAGGGLQGSLPTVIALLL